MDWNTMKGRAAFSATLLFSVSAVFVVYQFTATHLWGQPKQSPAKAGALPNILVPGPQSPVRIVGGSIKLIENKSSAGWNAMPSPCMAFTNAAAFSGQTIRNCIVSADTIDYSSIGLTGVNATPDPSWTMQDATWTITAFTRGAHEPRGVDICVSDGMNCGKGSLIAIAAFDDTPFNIFTRWNPSQLSPEPIDTNLYRYHDPDYNGKISNLLEYMGQITVTLSSGSSSYTCINGICQIYIGNPGS